MRPSYDVVELQRASIFLFWSFHEYSRTIYKARPRERAEWLNLSLRWPSLNSFPQLEKFPSGAASVIYITLSSMRYYY